MTRRPLEPRRCVFSLFWELSRAGDSPQITDEPQPGLYKRRLVRGGPWVPVQIWIEQEIGEDWELLSDQKLNAYQNGREVEVTTELWLSCCMEPITSDEYNYLLDLGRWAREHDPRDPHATPNKRVDWLRAPPPSFPKPRRRK